MKNMFYGCITSLATLIGTVALGDEYGIYDEVMTQHPELPTTLEGPCVFWSGPITEGPANYIGWLENNVTGEKWMFARVGNEWIYQSTQPLITARSSCYGMV